MPGKAAKLTLTERQLDILRSLSRSTTVPVRLRQRASIIVLAFQGLLNEEIARQVSLTHRQVGRWRRRWARAWHQLIDIECCESRAALRRAMEAVLCDQPRPGAPGKFSPEQVTQILAVACEPPEKSGRPITHWTVRELTDEVIRRGIVDSISPAQVSRYLREAALNRTGAATGSTPPRRMPGVLRSRSRRCVTPPSTPPSGSGPSRPTPCAWTR